MVASSSLLISTQEPGLLINMLPVNQQGKYFAFLLLQLHTFYYLILLKVTFKK